MEERGIASQVRRMVWRAFLAGSGVIAALTAMGVGLGLNRAARADTVLGKFRNTYYMLGLESDYPHSASSRTESVLDVDGQTLAKVSVPFKKKLELEGSGRLVDGRVLNFKARVEGQIRFEFSKYPYGRGVGQCPLEPFHSIAVDPGRIPLGAVVSIRETIGMRLPDGSRHDGLWKAIDIGSAIQDDRLDLFVGGGDQGWVLDQAGIGNLQALHVSLVTPPASSSCVDEAP